MASRAYSIGALAVADRRANAVGPLRLTCERAALRIDLLYVGRFSLGYVAPSVADAVSVRVPYNAVRVMMRDGDRLLLSIDPRVMRPYNRFALTRFGPEPLSGMMQAYRRRAMLRVALALLPWLVAGGCGWLAASAGAPLPLAGALAALAALLGWGLGRLWLRLSDRWQAGGVLRDALENEISRRMGLAPAQPVADADPEVLAQLERRRQVEQSKPLAAGARPRWLAFAVLSSLLLVLGAVHLVQRFGIAEEVLLDVPRAQTGWAAVGDSAVRAGELLDPRHPDCSCTRPAAALWAAGVPQLSFLVTPHRGAVDPLWLREGETYDIGHSSRRTEEDADDDDARDADARDDADDAHADGARDDNGAQDDDEDAQDSGDEEDARPRRRSRRRSRRSRRRRAPRMRVELDVAVVNNSAETLDTVSLVVTFARRDGQGRRHAIMERGLHWPAKLRPGGAVKWTVRAEGNELRIDSPHKRLLGDGLAPAAADAFFAQQKARLSSVRLHSAAMLAYLGDARAQAFLDAVGPLGRREQAIATTLKQLFEPLVVCASEGDSKAPLCVVNRSDKVLRGVVLTPRGREEPRWPVTDLFYPDRALAIDLDTELPREQLQVRPLPAGPDPGLEPVAP